MSCNILKAVVVSTNMQKTIVVEITKYVKHKKYKKFFLKKTKLFVHDPFNFCSTQDVVLIKKSKSFSKKKHWILMKKL